MSLCDRVLYLPDRENRGTPADEDLPYEDVFVATADGSKLHGWFLPATGPKARGTVLHLHGNAANITGHYKAACWLPASGYHLLTFDYRDYGRSEGRVTRAATIEDAAAALDYLRGRGDVENDRIFVFGQSLGGAVSIVLAARRRGQISGLVVDGAFSSYREIIRHHVMRNPLLLVLAWWFPYFVRRDFDAIDCVDRISPAPILFMHGTADRVVPARMSQALYDKARPPKELWLIEGVDHYAVWEEQPEAARRRVLDFFDRATRSIRESHTNTLTG